MTYSTFPQRVAAALIDFGILAAAGLAFHWLSPATRAGWIASALFSLLLGVAYHVAMVRAYGGTPGKRVMDLRIARLDGGVIGWREALLRFAVPAAGMLAGCIGSVDALLRMPEAAFAAPALQVAHAMDDLAPGFQWYDAVDRFVTAWGLSEVFVILLNRRRRSLDDFVAATVVLHEPAVPTLAAEAQ